MLGIFLLAALSSHALAVLAGTMAAHGYYDSFRDFLGLTVQQLRPIHTTFATAWIVLGGLTLIVFAWITGDDPPSARRGLLAVPLAGWILAGVIDITETCRRGLASPVADRVLLLLGVLLLAGWIVVVVVLFPAVRRAGSSLHGAMWFAGLVMVPITLLEGLHRLMGEGGEDLIAWLATGWSAHAFVADAGTLLVYGALAHLASCRGKDRGPAGGGGGGGAGSWLLVVVVLDALLDPTLRTAPPASFQGHAHFLLEASEGLLAAVWIRRVARDLRHPSGPVSDLASHAALWAMAAALLATIVHFPPLRPFLQGTHLVVADGMSRLAGTESAILWATILMVLETCGVPAPRVGRRTLGAAQVFLAGTILLMAAHGAETAWIRWFGPFTSLDPWVGRIYAHLLVAIGGTAGLLLLWIDGCWAAAILRASRRPAGLQTVGRRL